MKIFSVDAEDNKTLQLNYCPETLLIKSLDSPSKIQVRALGEGVICDLDATGATVMRNIRNNYSDGNYYAFRLADGLLKNKNIEIEVTAGDNSIEVFVYSTGEEGSCYIITERNTVLANTSQEFRKFFALGLGAFNPGDQLTINYNSGVTQLLNSADEVKALASESHQSVLLIDNLEQDVTSVVVVPTDNTTYYVQRLKL